jgi:hypothetical protein
MLKRVSDACSGEMRGAYLGGCGMFTQPPWLTPTTSTTTFHKLTLTSFSRRVYERPTYVHDTTSGHPKALHVCLPIRLLEGCVAPNSTTLSTGDVTDPIVVHHTRTANLLLYCTSSHSTSDSPNILEFLPRCSTTRASTVWVATTPRRVLTMYPSAPTSGASSQGCTCAPGAGA